MAITISPVRLAEIKARMEPLISVYAASTGLMVDLSADGNPLVGDGLDTVTTDMIADLLILLSAVGVHDVTPVMRMASDHHRNEVGF